MSAREDKIVNMWLDRREQAQNLRQLEEDQWRANMELYLNTRQTRGVAGQQWPDNKGNADAYHMQEVLLPQHIMGLRRNPRWFTAETDHEDLRPAIVAQSLLDKQFRKMDGFMVGLEGLKGCNIVGHITPKLVWTLEMGETPVQDIGYGRTASGEQIPDKFITRYVPSVVHNGPRLSIPEPFFMWQDPTGYERWFIERNPTASFAQMKEENKRFGGTLYDNLAKVSASRAYSDALNRGSGRRMSSGHNRDDLQAYVQGIPLAFREDPDNVDLWYCSGWVDPAVARYDDTQWRLQIIAEDSILLRDDALLTPNARPFYWNVRSIIVPWAMHGKSVLEWAEHDIDYRSFLDNAKRDEILFGIYRTYTQHADAEVSHQKMLKRPGGRIKVRPPYPNMSVDDVFSVLPQPPIMQEAFHESNLKQQEIFEKAGASGPFQNKPFGSRTTATEAGMIGQAHASRHDLQATVYDKTLFEECLKRMFELDQVRLRNDEWVQSAAYPKVRGPVNMTELQYNVDIRVDSGTHGSMDVQQVQGLREMMQIAATVPGGHTVIDLKRVIDLMAMRLGLDQFVTRTEEESRGLVEEERNQELLQAAFDSPAQTPA
jgi:hypothetical protein